MNIPWETILVVVLVALAAGYLFYKVVRIVCFPSKKRGSCGDCPFISKNLNK